jgi:hypothetical protein
MDESRQALARRVVANLCEQAERLDFLPFLIAFDNGSRFDCHCASLPAEVVVCRANRNIGYWSAINWVLRHHEGIMNRTYDFLYIVESDLVHYDMERLADCERFLTDHSDIGAVRTQEFSVRWRWLYDKRAAFLPFARRHSLVVQYDAATGQRARFKPVDRQKRIYSAAFHTKLPALNRMAAMRTIFDALARQEQVTELEFMRRYHDLYPTIAVLDGGIYRSFGNDPNSGLVTGSWTDPLVQTALGYENTRVTQILTNGFEIVIGTGTGRQASA